MIPRNHIKCSAPFHIEYVLFKFTKKQDADRRHAPCSEKGVILWSQFHKVSQPDWLLRNETDIPQVVCCRSLSTANCGHSLTWSPRSHTHTLRVHNGCDFLHACGLLVDWIGVSGAMHASAAVVTTLFLFFCLHHHPTYGQVSESKVTTSECA